MASWRPKHVAAPNMHFNIILVLCSTESSVDIILRIFAYVDVFFLFFYCFTTPSLHRLTSYFVLA
jgi:hypothetical protein